MGSQEMEMIAGLLGDERKMLKRRDEKRKK